MDAAVAEHTTLTVKTFTQSEGTRSSAQLLESVSDRTLESAGAITI